MGLASTSARLLGTTASTYGGDASGIAGSLVPFETGQLLHPQGYSPQDLTAQLVAGSAGAGGATAGIVGNLNQTAAATNNYGGFAGASDLASRNAAKAAAGNAEGVAAGNAQLKVEQQRQAASTLGNLYGTDVGAQTSDLKTQQDAIQQANQEGFFSRLQQITGMLTNGANASANVLKASQ